MAINKKNKQWIVRIFWIYLVTLILFSLIGDQGLIASYRLWNQSTKLDQEVSNLHQDIDSLNDQVQKFRKDDRTIQQYAREKLNMAGDHEIQFIFK